MNIIARIDEVATKLRMATGAQARYLYLGESEVRELDDYIMAGGGKLTNMGTGATVGGLYVLTVISASHLAVS